MSHNKQELLDEIYAIAERLKEVSLSLNQAAIEMPEHPPTQKHLANVRRELNDLTRYLWSEVWKIENKS